MRHLILKKMKSLFPLLSIVVIFFSFCGEKQPDKSGAARSPVNPEDSLFHEVMRGHDEGMAKIGRIKKYSGRLKSVIDSINGNSTADKSVLPALQRVKDSLDAANASMFTWMDGFKADTLTGMSARMGYLEDQKASVKVVRDLIHNSLRLYDSLDKQYK